MPADLPAADRLTTMERLITADRHTGRKILIRTAPQMIPVIIASLRRSLQETTRNGNMPSSRWSVRQLR